MHPVPGGAHRMPTLGVLGNMGGGSGEVTAGTTMGGGPRASRHRPTTSATSGTPDRPTEERSWPSKSSCPGRQSRSSWLPSCSPALIAATWIIAPLVIALDSPAPVLDGSQVSVSRIRPQQTHTLDHPRRAALGPHARVLLHLGDHGVGPAPPVAFLRIGFGQVADPPVGPGVQDVRDLVGVVPRHLGLTPGDRGAVGRGRCTYSRILVVGLSHGP